MAGNGRSELSSASPDAGSGGNYPNGQRGSYSGPSLDRSGSFRESNDSRMFGSGKGASRGGVTLTGDMPPLSQCLMLEPILIGDQKYTRSGELRRALGFSVGSSSEDNSFAAAHLKASPSVAMEELKRFRANVADTCIKASGRAKKLDEHLHKLNKYFEAMTPKKLQRNELLTNERLGASNLKMGTQIHRSPSELVPKLEDRPKNVILNKRVRTSMAETRAEFRSNGLPRQPLTVSKDRDMLKDNNADPDGAEEKIRRLPIGGESWDRKMKRKRSVGAVFSRPNDNDADLKRTIHHKLTSEPGLQSCDSQGLRSGACSGAGGMNKPDVASPASANARAALKNDQEKSVLSRDVTSGLNKERLLPKASIKVNIREEIHSICPSPVTKGKASRAPRSGSTTVTNTVANIPRTLESWELPPSSNKNPSICGVNSRKRTMPTGSSSPPITQWVGQRPQKISRIRRANLVSPVSNHDEVRLSSEGCSPSDFGARLTTSGANGSLLIKGAATGTQIIKVKPESVSSPARLSESEESGAGENRLKDKGIGSSEMEDKAVNNVQNVNPSAILAKKNKLLTKEEIADGMRRQGRSGRVSSVSRASISPIREKLDNVAINKPAINKPLRSIRPGSDKNGSKSGRPLKKLSDRKGVSRLGPASGGSPDFTGESDDDREELIAAANLAYDSNLLACSSTFWKKFEALFASLSSEEKSYLSQQLKLAEEYHDGLSHIFGGEKDITGDHMLEEIPVLDTLSGERNRHMQNGLGRKDLAPEGELIDQFQSSMLLAGVDSGTIFDKMTPLYQRVLSALIIEDDLEELEESGAARCMPHQNIMRNSPDETHFYVDSESKFRDRLEFECESNFGVQMQKNGGTNSFFSCNGYGAYSRSPNVPDPPCNGELLQGDKGYVHPNVEVLDGSPQCDSDRPQSLQKNSACISSYDGQYEQMPFEDKLVLELHSVGLYPETVPDLHDKEDEVINQEVVRLQRELYQQTDQKKMCLDKIHKAIQEGKDMDERDLEHVAMNKLVELAYKKLLATRGSLAIKLGIPKVSKQVALAFAKRTIGRCRKFEESGASCFNEPALRDIIFAAPPRVYEADPLTRAGFTVANGSFPGIGDRGLSDGFEPCTDHLDQAFAKNGPITNRGKKKEVLLDDVGGNSGFRSSLGSSLLGGAKGKRSERDRDKDISTKTGVARAGRSLGNSKGERKTKTKPKQKTAQLSTSGNGYVNKYMETTHPVYPLASGSAELINNNGNRKREVGLVASSNVPPESLKEKKESMDFANLPLNDIDTIEELGVGSDLGGPQDLNSWFNFDVDGLQDNDSVGLEIPMDDLSELNMF